MVRKVRNSINGKTILVIAILLIAQFDREHWDKLYALAIMIASTTNGYKKEKMEERE
jgi:hypothetical protein